MGFVFFHIYYTDCRYLNEVMQVKCLIALAHGHIQSMLILYLWYKVLAAKKGYEVQEEMDF
jgi:hypothetical protein